MPKIFVHALEGEPEDPINFTGKTERDIRVSWLVGNPVGSGPWDVDRRRTTDEKIVLVPSRSGAKTKSKIEQVHLPFIPDGKEVAERLLLPYSDPRHVDFVPSLTDPDTFPQLEAADREGCIKLVDQSHPNLFYLGFYWGKAPFDDANFRRAVVAAIDVQTHADLKPSRGGRRKGAAEPATGPIPPSMHPRGKHPLRKQFCGTAKAKGFLRRCDLKAKKTSHLTLIYNSANAYSAQLVGRIADDIERNLGITVVRMGYSTWGKALEQVKKRWEGDMFLYSWHHRRKHPNDPQDFLKALFHSKSQTNLTGYDGVDKLLDAARPNYDAIEAKVLDDAPMVFLSHVKRKAAYNTRVKHLTILDGTLPRNRLTEVDVDMHA